MHRRGRRVPRVHFFEAMAELVPRGRTVGQQLEILTRRCPRGADQCFGLERLAHPTEQPQ